MFAEADPTESNVPTSTSHVLLRAGDWLTLQCHHASSWSLDGLPLASGDKYTIAADALVIKHTGITISIISIIQTDFCIETTHSLEIVIGPYDRGDVVLICTGRMNLGAYFDL